MKISLHTFTIKENNSTKKACFNLITVLFLAYVLFQIYQIYTDRVKILSLSDEHVFTRLIRILARTNSSDPSDDNLDNDNEDCLKCFTEAPPAPPDSPVTPSVAMTAVSQALFVFTWQSLMSLDDLSPREASFEKAAS